MCSAQDILRQVEPDCTQAAQYVLGGLVGQNRPDLHQVFDAGTQAVVKVVLPHDAGHAGVGEDVGVACLLLALPWEGPVLLRAACRHSMHHLAPVMLCIVR